jgi:hypothetical protein
MALERSFHFGQGPLPASEKGLDCNVRVFQDGTRWHAIANCSTPEGPFTVDASCDEASLAPLVGRLRAAEAAASNARQQALAKVGQMDWGRRSRFDALAARLTQRDPSAIRLAIRLRACARAGNPRCIRAYRILSRLVHDRLAGAPVVGGWGLPRRHAAGIDLDSQRRPRKSLPLEALRNLKDAIRRTF